jgi:hypothetical protein
MIKDDWSNF